MNEASSPKDLKSSNSPPGGGASNYDEFKKNLGIFPEDREDEKVPDTEEKKVKENTLHGPSVNMFIKKISTKRIIP